MRSSVSVLRSLLPSSDAGKVGIESHWLVRSSSDRELNTELNTVAAGQKDVDGRHEAGHDGMGCGLVLVRAVVYVLFEIDEDIHTLVAAGAAVRAGWGIGEPRDML